LHFAEPDRLGPGQRLFSVALQGRTVLEDFDIVKEAGGPQRAVVREFPGIRVRKHLSVTLTPSDGAVVRETVLCGIEAVAE
jgi:hypothetical protein